MARVLRLAVWAMLLLGSATGRADPSPGLRLVAQIEPAGSMYHVAFSPDGKQVLTGGNDQTVCLWDAGSGKLLRQLTGHTAHVFSVRFSPDGKRALTASHDRTARLWDATTGKELLCLNAAFFLSAAFSPDGTRLLTTGSGFGPHLWDAATGKELLRLTGHAHLVMSAAFSPDGKRVLSASHDKTARLWDATTGKELLRLTGHISHVRSASFSPDGKRVLTASGEFNGRAGSGDKTARLWDAATGKELLRLDGHAGPVMSAAFSPDGKQVLTGAQDKTARLWDAATGKELLRLDGHAGLVMSAAFSPDGKRVLTWSDDKTARIWDAGTGKQLLRLTGRHSEIISVAFSPDGKRVLTGTDDRTAQMWDAATGKELLRLAGHASPVMSAAFSPDGKQVLTGAQDKTARLWDAAAGKQLLRLTGHGGYVSSVAFSPDGKRLLAGARDKSPRLWDAAAGQELLRLDGHRARVFSVAFSPDGDRLLTGSDDRTARVWDAATGKELLRLTGHNGQVRSASFSPDGKRLLTGSDDKTARLWDAATGKELLRLDGHAKQVVSAAFSPDGKRVLTASTDKTARLWDAAGKELLRLEGHGGTVSSAAFSPDGKRLLTGSDDRTARLWDAATGKELLRLTGHNGQVSSAAFSPDGKRVLTGSEDGTTRLWDAAAGKEICQLVSFRDGSWAVAAPDGRYDSSDGGEVDGLHWVAGLEPIALGQLKERYYEPGLLAELLGFSKAPLRDVPPLDAPKLFPAVDVAPVKPGDTKLTIRLTARGGGIGPVRVLLNGKEVTADARGGIDLTGKESATLTVDIPPSHLMPGRPNRLTVIAWNQEGYLSSRGMVRELEPPPPAKEAEKPRLFAVVAGVSEYANEALNLRYAAKDAEDFAAALKKAAGGLLSPERVEVVLLATSAKHARPTRANIEKAFKDAAARLKPNDVFVVYLAGHGVALAGEGGMYCYLTCEARSGTAEALADPEVRSRVSVSSGELTQWAKRVPAQKQVMVLDTCAAGAAAKKLMEHREIAGDQVRALARLRDRTGFHVLMGCSADRVSYETTRFAQGLLTYSLLRGMQGASLRGGEYLDVSPWFQFAADHVPTLARDIGGVQCPLVLAPRGTSFDIGRLDADARKGIVLASPRPLVLRPVMIDPEQGDDHLGLLPLLRKRLADGGTRGTSPVYVDADELPGAVRPGGTYTVKGDAVVVSLVLRKDGKTVHKAKVEGKKSDLPGLAAKVAEEVARALAAG